MTTHHWLDSFRSLIGMVEGNSANIVVEDVSLDNAVKKGATNEAEFTVDRCSSSTDVVPAGARVVRKRSVGVLKVGDGN